MNAQQQIIKLTILVTSDIHGNVFPINYANNEKKEQGLAKLATVIKEERKKNPGCILIDNGDLIQGTPLTYHYARIDNSKSNPIIKILNYLKYDAAVIGNHEFNYGQELLKRAISESKFPWLSANLIDKDSNRPYSDNAYIIKELGEGIRIAIIGATTKYIPNWEEPSNILNIEFQDPVIHIKDLVQYLKKEKKVDAVIVSYHGGFERSIDTGSPTENLTGENQGYEMCTKVPEIDVLLTGHQHRKIEHKCINGVMLLQPGSHGKYLGKAELSFKRSEGAWVICDIATSLIDVSAAKADGEILNLVRQYEEATQSWLDRPIGKIKGDMLINNPMDLRTKDNALIEFINKVQMEYSGADISNTALFDNHSKGFPPEVTMRDIVSNYIYPNTLKVIKVCGRDIKAALERCASYFDTYDGNEIKVNSRFFKSKVQHYNYDMWEGIEYLINISRPCGERVVKLEYKGHPVEADKEYQVVMNNYRAGGGGEYLMFQNKPVIREINTDVSELIANYILERGFIEAATDNNWEVIHD